MAELPKEEVNDDDRYGRSGSHSPNTHVQKEGTRDQKYDCGGSRNGWTVLRYVLQYANYLAENKVFKSFYESFSEHNVKNIYF